MDASHFDVAPFALPNTPRNEVRFEEPRDVTAIEVEFDREPGSRAAISYLRKTWPDVRIEEVAAGDPCALGWVAQDDWFNVEWTPAAVILENSAEGTIRIRFQGLREEFPDKLEYDVAFRRTLGIRIDKMDEVSIKTIRVFSASTAARSTLRVQCDAGTAVPEAPGVVSAYNATAGEVRPAKEGVADGTWLVNVSHMAPSHPYCGDEGLLTFRFRDHTFTISLTALEEDGPIWYPEAGVLIADAEDPTDIAAYHARHRDDKTLVQRVPSETSSLFRGPCTANPGRTP